MARLAGPSETVRDAAIDPRLAICDAKRALVVTSRKRPEPDPTYGRSRTVLAVSNRDVLYLYAGSGCSPAIASGARR